jgi:hypothetical protein
MWRRNALGKVLITSAATFAVVGAGSAYLHQTYPVFRASIVSQRVDFG